MSSFVLHEGIYLRGFFSNYITIATSIRFLVNHGINFQNIKLGPSLFRLYGNPLHWFDPEICGTQGIEWDAVQTFDMNARPHNQELQTIRAILRYMPWNSRVHSFIPNITLRFTTPTLGVHFRGTDHNIDDGWHGRRVNLDVYQKCILQEFNNTEFKQLFLCSDEEGVVEILYDWAAKMLPSDVSIIYNKFTKTSGPIGVHCVNKSFDRIQLADEVIQDMLCLSKCHTIIGKFSNVTTTARLLNQSLKMIYCDNLDNR